jgi:hypothetical protein
MYNILQHNLRNEALTLQDFHINSPYGRLGKHPPQGRWEGDVENFQYHLAFGVLSSEGKEMEDGQCTPDLCPH